MNPVKVEAWRCSTCGKTYVGKDGKDREYAESCCRCATCDKPLNDNNRLPFSLCKECYQKMLIEKYARAKAEPVDPNHPLVYSEVLDKYFNFDELADVWHDYLCDVLGYSDSEAEKEESSLESKLTALRVYTCVGKKPHWPGVADLWSDYLPVDSDDDPPGDYEKVDDVMYKHLQNCGPWSYMASSKKWNGELTGES